VADLLAHHAAAHAVDDRRRGAVPDHRRAEGVRHRVRDDRRWAGVRLGDAQPLRVPDQLQVPASRLRLGAHRDVLLAGPRHHPAAAPRAEVGVVKPRKALRQAVFYLLLAATLAFLVFPLAWMFMGSFKTQADFMSYPPRWFFTPTLANYEKVFVRGDFLKFTVNSLVIALGSTAMSLLLGVPAAYSVARYRQTRLGMVLLISRMAPGIA